MLAPCPVEPEHENIHITKGCHIRINGTERLIQLAFSFGSVPVQRSRVMMSSQINGLLLKDRKALAGRIRE